MSKDAPSRILHVPRRFSQNDWGGTEAVVTELCRYQRAQGFVPEIHTSRALNPISSENRQDIPIRRYGHCYPFLGLSKDEVHSLDLKGGICSRGPYILLCAVREMCVSIMRM